MSNNKSKFEEVFLSHKWGNSANAGKFYKRPYNKTKSSAKEYMKSQGE